MNTRRFLLTFGALVVLVMSTAPAQGQTPVTACATTESAIVPACPSDLDVERVRFTELDVTWEWERSVSTNAKAKEFLVRYQEGGLLSAGFVTTAGAKTIGSKKVRLNSDDDEDYALTLTGLKPGLNYVVGVTAVAPTGAPGNNSTEMGVEEKTDPARAPDDVLGLELTAGDMMIMAMWDEATDNGSDVTGYEVQHREMDKDWPTTSSRSGTISPHDKSTMWSISNLENGTEYEVRVRAYSYGMTSEDIWSDGEMATPMAGGATAPTPTPTPALPLFGAVALGAGLLAGGRARLRRRREQHQLTR